MKSYTKIYLPKLPAYCKWNFYSVKYFILFINELIWKVRHDWIENSRINSMIICFSLKANLSKRLQAFNLLLFFSKTSAERRCFNSCLSTEKLRLFMIFQNNLSPEMISSENLVEYHIQNNSFSSNVVMNNLHESTLSRQQASLSFQKNNFVAFHQVFSFLILSYYSLP